MMKSTYSKVFLSLLKNNLTYCFNEHKADVDFVIIFSPKNEVTFSELLQRYDYVGYFKKAYFCSNRFLFDEYFYKIEEVLVGQPTECYTTKKLKVGNTLYVVGEHKLLIEREKTFNMLKDKLNTVKYFTYVSDNVYKENFISADNIVKPFGFLYKFFYGVYLLIKGIWIKDYRIDNMLISNKKIYFIDFGCGLTTRYKFVKSLVVMWIDFLK